MPLPGRATAKSRRALYRANQNMKKTLVTRVSRSPSRYERLRILAVDECCNNGEIVALAEKLLRGNYIDGCFPIWDQARVRADGTVIHVSAGYLGSVPPDFDWGTPKKHHSFPDSVVAQLVETYVKSYDVFFLSENTKMNEGGIRGLLRNASGRATDTHLVALYKKGKTEYSDYSEQVAQKIQDWVFTVDFQEVLI